MGLALYRKYRSRTLDEVVGQSHVTTLLRRAIEQDRIGHAYLFTGPRGVGKTSIARILAYQLNDLPYDVASSHLDIIEIDAASNNGVEDIRDLRDKVQIAPVSAKKKVYIVDEVHMLSKPAFNALLKTLEEPPEHVVFILATTDVDKVPETILSRTQRFTFRRASVPAIIDNLKRIAKAEKVKVNDDTLSVIAEHSDGSFRDSVSLFDQLLSVSDDTGALSKQDVVAALGLAPDDAIGGLLDVVQRGDIASIDAQLKELENSGIPARVTALQLSTAIRAGLPGTAAMLPLLDELIDVSKSTNPSMKLLTTLGLFAQPTVEPPQQKPQQPQNTPKPSPTPAEPSDTPTPSTPKPKDAPAAPQPTPKPSKAKSAKATSFDWTSFLEHVHKHYVAVYSVLSKCQYDYDAGNLVIYARTQFYKKKLDDQKYRSLIMKSLEATGHADIELQTVPSTKPPEDSRAARVAAMMGGGEEVKLEETT